MKTLKITPILFTLVGIFAFLSSPVQAQDKKHTNSSIQQSQQEQVIDRVMASVDGISILESQVKNTLRLMHKKDTAENRTLALNSLIDDIVIRIAINKYNISVTPQEIEHLMETIAAQNGLTYGQLLDGLDYQGINVTEYQRNLAHQIILDKLRYEVINNSFNIDREKMIELGQKLFNEAKAKGDIKKITEKQYQVRHILLKVNPLLTDRQAKTELNKIRTNILNGKITFAKAALDYSKDYLSGANGGDLGFAFANKYVPEFAKVILSTPKGKISTPFKTKFGWHILEVTNIRLENVTKDMYMQQAYMKQVQEQAKELEQSWVNILRKQENVKIFN